MKRLSDYFLDSFYLATKTKTGEANIPADIFPPFIVSADVVEYLHLHPLEFHPTLTLQPQRNVRGKRQTAEASQISSCPACL